MTRFRRFGWVTVAMVVWSVSHAHGKVQTETIQYNHGSVTLHGLIAYDDAVEGKRPGVLVVHEWWGLNEYAQSRARKLAGLGFVAFAVDMYGGGKTTKNAEQAGHWSGQFRGTQMMRDRARTGLGVLARHDRVDNNRIAAIGYCFGGTTVLQLAYSGADIRGVASFHSSLPSPEPEDMQPNHIKASILVCHGGNDSFVPAERIADFKQKMSQTDADWQMVTYGGAKHSFTNPDADATGIQGLGYNANADRRSWQLMKSFLHELFGSSEKPFR